LQSKYWQDLYHQDVFIGMSATAIQVAVNRPEAGSRVLRLGPQGKIGDFFTNKGHLQVDQALNLFLDLVECRSEELRKIDSIWGIMPA
jgi:hypothetical protein